MAKKSKRDTVGKVKDSQEVIFVSGIKLDPAQKVVAYNVVLMLISNLPHFHRLMMY